MQCRHSSQRKDSKASMQPLRTPKISSLRSKNLGDPKALNDLTQITVGRGRKRPVNEWVTSFILFLVNIFYTKFVSRIAHGNYKSIAMNTVGIYYQGWLSGNCTIQANRI
jgi:hypothetical protein